MTGASEHGGKPRWNRVWQLLYPLLLYLVIYEGADYLLTVLFRVIFSEELSPLWPLVLAAALAILPLCQIYKTVPVVRAEKPFDEKTPRELLFVLGVVLFGVVLNILAARLPLEELSPGYSAANEVLFAGSLPLLVLSNVLVIPFLEELLYRGILCGQLTLWYGTLPGAALSAILFGIFHFNVIQFLYAVLMGFLLGLLFSKTKKLYLSYLAHALTNLVVILAAVLSM